MGGERVDQTVWTEAELGDLDLLLRQKIGEMSEDDFSALEAALSSGSSWDVALGMHEPGGSVSDETTLAPVSDARQNEVRLDHNGALATLSAGGVLTVSLAGIFGGTTPPYATQHRPTAPAPKAASLLSFATNEVDAHPSTANTSSNSTATTNPPAPVVKTTPSGLRYIKSDRSSKGSTIWGDYQADGQMPTVQQVEASEQSADISDPHELPIGREVGIYEPTGTNMEASIPVLSGYTASAVGTAVAEVDGNTNPATYITGIEAEKDAMISPSSDELRAGRTIGVQVPECQTAELAKDIAGVPLATSTPMLAGQTVSATAEVADDITGGDFAATEKTIEIANRSDLISATVEFKFHTGNSVMVNLPEGAESRYQRLLEALMQAAIKTDLPKEAPVAPEVPSSAGHELPVAPKTEASPKIDPKQDIPAVETAKPKPLARHEVGVRTTKMVDTGNNIAAIPSLHGVSADRIQFVVRTLESLGVTPKVSAWLGGDTTWEGLDNSTEDIGDNGRAFGYISAEGARRANMPSDPVGQLRFILEEDIPKYGPLLNNLLNKADPSDSELQAAINEWEAEGVVGQRFEIAQAIWTAMQTPEKVTETRQVSEPIEISRPNPSTVSAHTVSTEPRRSDADHVDAKSTKPEPDSPHLSVSSAAPTARASEPVHQPAPAQESHPMSTAPSLQEASVDHHVQEAAAPRIAPVPEVAQNNLPTRQKVVQIASQQLSEWQAQGPSYSKTGYLKYSQGREEEWCADFVSWVYEKAGYPLTNSDPDIDRVQTIKQLGETDPRFKYITPESGTTPEPGDLAIHLGTTSDGHKISHVNVFVGMSSDGVAQYIGGDQGHGPYPGGSVVSTERGVGYWDNFTVGYVQPVAS